MDLKALIKLSVAHSQAVMWSRLSLCKSTPDGYPVPCSQLKNMHICNSTQNSAGST